MVAGNYSVTVTDAFGCFQNQIFTIEEPTPLTSTTAVTSDYNGQDVSCNGSSDGSAQVSANGGTAPYSYQWSNGITSSVPTGLPAGTYNVVITDINRCVTNNSITLTQPDILQLSTFITDVLCHGNATGAIDLSVLGGVPGYTYSWSNGSNTQDLAGLTAGTYTVTVLDANGCNEVLSSPVTEPQLPLSGVISINPVSCFGGNDGSVNIACSGGTAPYNYQWSNAVTDSVAVNLTAGTYTVVVTDNNGCTFTIGGNVTEPSNPLTVTGSVADVSCFGYSNGAIDISVSGGTPGYTYQWSNGSQTQDIQGIPAGTYSVVVTDANGCNNATFQATVNQPLDSLIITAAITNLKCYQEPEGSVNVTVTGGTSPYQYNWSNGASTEDIQNLFAGTYNLTVVDANGCNSNTFTAVVTQPDQAITLSGTVTNVNCFGGVNGGVDLTVIGGNPQYNYIWNNGSTLPTLTGVPAGVYTVILEDQSECRRTATFQVIQPPPLFINGDVIDNPCFGDVKGRIDVTVSGGVPGYQYSWSTGATSQDIFNLSTGFYTLSVTDANNCSGTAGFTVFEAPPLSISADTIHTIFIGESVLITAEVSGGTTPYSFQWTPEETLSCPTCQSTYAGPLQNTNYRVTIVDGNNCETGDQVFVEVLQDIFIPNSFTPGTDGVNDTFKPVVRMVKEGSFMIFNRWGEKIFSTNNLDQGWDGTYMDEPVKQDVYVYQVDVLFYNGVEKSLRGSVTLLR